MTYSNSTLMCTINTEIAGRFIEIDVFIIILKDLPSQPNNPIHGDQVWKCDESDRPHTAPQPPMVHERDQKCNIRIHIEEIQRYVDHSITHTGNVKSTFVFVFEGVKATVAPIFPNGDLVPDALGRNVHRSAANHRSANRCGRDDIVACLEGMGSTDVHDVGG